MKSALLISFLLVLPSSRVLAAAPESGPTKVPIHLHYAPAGVDVTVGPGCTTPAVAPGRYRLYDLPTWLDLARLDAAHFALKSEFALLEVEDAKEREIADAAARRAETAEADLATERGISADLFLKWKESDRLYALERSKVHPEVWVVLGLGGALAVTGGALMFAWGLSR